MMNLTPDEKIKLRAALEVLNATRTRATDDVGMFSDDHTIDCCERGIDGIVDLLETTN